MTAVDLDVNKVREKIEQFIKSKDLEGLTVYSFALQEAARSCIMRNLKAKLTVASKIAQAVPDLLSSGRENLISKALGDLVSDTFPVGTYKLPWE